MKFLSAKIKSDLIQAGVISEYEDSKFWFSKKLCYVFWFSSLLAGFIVNGFSLLIKACKEIKILVDLFTILDFVCFFWILFSFIIFVVNLIKWKNVVGPWGNPFSPRS